MYSNLFSPESIEELTAALQTQFLPAIWETFYVTLLSTAFAIVIGLPLGVLLVAGERDGVLPLPVIINNKTVDPTDPQSPAVVQLETAMGAAIGLFEGAICVQVDRMRFLPVKTTNDLFIMRSDRFHLTDSYEMEDGNYIFPNVDLDPRYYKNIEDFNERFPYNVPSLAAANSVSIKGDWTFGRDVIMFADARLEDRNEPSYVPNGEYVGPMGIEPGDWV